MRCSDYATKVFGFATFGRLYGAITCISGVLTFSQYGLDALTAGPLGGDPTLVNVVLAILGTFVGLFLTIYVAVKSREYQEEETVEMKQEQDERMRLIRGERGEYGTMV